MVRKTAIVAALVLLAGTSMLFAYEPCAAPCGSVRESKWHGLFVCQVSLDPDITTREGKRGIIREAWIERNCKWSTVGYRTQILPGYRLCFALGKNPSATYSFSLPGSTASFTAINNTLAYQYLEKIDGTGLTVEVWEEGRTAAIKRKCILTLEASWKAP